MLAVRVMLFALVVVLTTSPSFSYEVVYGLFLEGKSQLASVAKKQPARFEGHFKYTDSRNLVVRLEFAKNLSSAEKEKIRAQARDAGLVIEGSTANFHRLTDSGPFESQGFGFEKKLFESLCVFCSKGDSINVNELSWKMSSDNDADASNDSYTMKLKVTGVTHKDGKESSPFSLTLKLGAKVDRIDAKQALKAILEKFKSVTPQDRHTPDLARQIRILPDKEFEAAWRRIPGDNGPVPESGFTNRALEPKVIFVRATAPPHTITHELLHLMSNPDLHEVIPSKINEGITQMLTIKALLQKDGNLPVKVEALEYMVLVAVVNERLVRVVGLPAILKAYFGRDRNDFENLRDIYDRKKGPGAFQTFLQEYGALTKSQNNQPENPLKPMDADDINKILRQ